MLPAIWLYLHFLFVGSLQEDEKATVHQSPQILHTSQISKNQKISICLGDITEIRDADVIVNAANGALQHNGGLAKTMANKGGPVIQRNSDKYVKENGQLQEGEVWMTNLVGNLHCKALIHAVGPKWQGGHLQEDSLLHNVCSNILKAAEGYKSICIPAISSGIFNFPLEKCATILIKAITDYFFSMQKSSITCINLCLYLKDDAETFLKVLKAHLIPESTVLPSSTSKRDKKHKFASIIQEQKDSSKGKGLSKPEKCINQEEKDSSKGKGMSKTDKCRNEGAFNLAKAVREMKRDANQHIRPRKGNSHGQSKEILDNSINLDEACKYWIESFGLLISDERILESNRSWLNASTIDTSLRLLAAQFKGISGFQILAALLLCLSLFIKPLFK